MILNLLRKCCATAQNIQKVSPSPLVAVGVSLLVSWTERLRFVLTHASTARWRSSQFLA